VPDHLRFGLIGTGWIGRFHAETLAADTLVHPQYAAGGYLDTSVVQLRFDNGAFATAEANFQTVCGYDVRGEVFGSEGVVLAAGTEPSVTARDARVALEIALAAAESVRTGSAVQLTGGVRT
jgi:myo-inositol 2-dehydrogenase / D-chiro-inositol 1-dehydrogenase